jgi:hypothetical protein
VDVIPEGRDALDADWRQPPSDTHSSSVLDTGP